MSAVLDLPGVLAHGRAELEQTMQETARHAQAAAGCCACGHAWPCHERGILVTYAEYWMLRLSLLEATEPLEVIRP